MTDLAPGLPRYDAEIEAAMREVDDMLAGRVPTQGYASVDEMMDDLKSDLDPESVRDGRPG